MVSYSIQSSSVELINRRQDTAYTSVNQSVEDDSVRQRRSQPEVESCRGIPDSSRSLEPDSMIALRVHARHPVATS